MASQSAIALTAFITWTVFLIILMEILRTRLVLSNQIAANEFKPDNANLSPFMQRLSRAHANCIESLPLFGGLLLVAIATGQTAVTDSLAYLLVAARVVQSTAHLASLNIVAVNIRFAAFTVQLAIAAYWSICLLMAFANQGSIGLWPY